MRVRVSGAMRSAFRERCAGRWLDAVLIGFNAVLSRFELVQCRRMLRRRKSGLH